jgi:hypothetical protein
MNDTKLAIVVITGRVLLDLRHTLPFSFISGFFISQLSKRRVISCGYWTFIIGIFFNVRTQFLQIFQHPDITDNHLVLSYTFNIYIYNIITLLTSMKPTTYLSPCYLGFLKKCETAERRFSWASNDAGFCPAGRTSSHAIESQSTWAKNQGQTASDLSLTSHIVTFPGNQGWVGVKHMPLRVGCLIFKGGMRVGWLFRPQLKGGMALAGTPKNGGMDFSRPIIRPHFGYRTLSRESALSDPLSLYRTRPRTLSLIGPEPGHSLLSDQDPPLIIGRTLSRAAKYYRTDPEPDEKSLSDHHRKTYSV